MRCRFFGRGIGALAAFEIVTLGLALVPEGRRLFASLTVEENLLIGSDRRPTGDPVGGTLTASIGSFRC